MEVESSKLQCYVCIILKGNQNAVMCSRTAPAQVWPHVKVINNEFNKKSGT